MTRFTRKKIHEGNHMMSKPQPVDLNDRGVSFLFEAAKANMGFVPNSARTMARIPAVMASFLMLGGLVTADPKVARPWLIIKVMLKNVGWMRSFINSKDRVPLYLRNLVAYASSNAAECRYCQAHTIGEALRNGAPPAKIEALWDYENSSEFDAAEKAALRFGFAAGSIPNGVTSEHYDQLREFYSEKQIVELVTTVAVFGFLNRWNDTVGTQLEAEPRQVAEKYLSAHGWEIGKHE